MTRSTKTIHQPLRRSFLLVLFLVSIGCAPADAPPKLEELGMQPMKFEPATPKTWVLPNGIRVFYMFDDEIPTMSGQLFFPGGSVFDPPGLVGLAAATGSQIREGGVQGEKPEKTNLYLESIGANIESSFGDEYGSIGFSCLEDDFDTVFHLFGRFVRTPAFDAQKLALWKSLAKDRIHRRKDDPSTMASMLFERLVYGEDTPWSRSISDASLGRIRRERMMDFHQRFVIPDHAILALSGSVPEQRVRASISEVLGSLPARNTPAPELPPVGKPAPTGVYLLQRDFAQATVLTGHRGPTRHAEVLYPLSIYNRVFGAGALSSTLFSDIRTRLGLAYSVYGGFAPGPVIGVFQIGMGTRSDQAPAALRRVYELAVESREQAPAQEKFFEAKTAVERSFVFRFAKVDAVVERAAMQALLGYPADYDKNYLERISRVTRQGTLEAAEEWVDPPKFVTAMVGKVAPEDIRATLGDVPIYIVTFDTEPHIVGPWAQ